MGSVGPLPTDRPRWDPPLNRPSEGRRGPHVPGPPHSRGGPVLGLAELTLMGVEWDRGAHILHSLFSVPVGPYDPDRRLFGCRGELPPEGLPAITNIPVASFAALRAVSALSREDHRVHLEGPPPSGWRTAPCGRASNKEEGRSLSCQGLTILPPDATASLFHLEGSVGKFSKELFPLLAGRDPSYEEALDWIQFAFTGDKKGQYAAPSHTKFSFASPVEGEPLFLPALERLQTLYPGAYARGATSTHGGAEFSIINLSKRTHPGAHGFNSFLGGGDPSPIQPSSLGGESIDSPSITQKSWLEGGSTYGGQAKIDLLTLAGAEDVFAVGEGRDGVGVTENPPPPP